MSPANTVPDPTPASDDDLLEFAQEHGRHHLPSVGTCKMGPATDPLAVVDHELTECTASPEFASSIAGSCRRSFPATPTRRR